MDLIFLLLAFVGGAVAWHFFHARAAVALASLEARIAGLESKPSDSSAATAPTQNISQS